jgi:hypothetical protein
MPDVPQVEATPKVVLYGADGRPLTRPVGFVGPKPEGKP